MGKQNWSALGPLKRAFKKISFLLSFRKWGLSSILWNASSSSSSGTIRRLSFNDRIGLHGVIGDVESDHQITPVRALERARSHGSSSDDDIDKRAEIFITNFRRQLLMERQVSLQLRFRLKMVFSGGNRSETSLFLQAKTSSNPAVQRFNTSDSPVTLKNLPLITTLPLKPLQVEEAEPKQETAKYNDKVRLWRCAICNYDNDESMTACDFCEVIRNPVPGNFKRDGGGVNLFNSRSPNTSAGITETDKSSDIPSTSMPKGKQDNMDDNSHSMNGALQQISGGSASISKGRPGVNEGNVKKNGIVGTQSSDKMSDSTSSLLPKGKDKSVDYSSSSTNMGESLGLKSNLNDMSLSDKSGSSYMASAKRPKSSAKYQPDKWMLPGKSENALTQLNLAIVGHVDSGKSTLSGRLLHLLGRITQKEMHKYEKEAKLQGKGSFAYAWALDESPEERERGITMTVAVAYFDSKRYHVVVLDSPGHKDFVPNMISGATQADAAILVIDASVGGFEAGMDSKGQTREHALLIRSFGVDQIIVAVNKMDSVEYSKDRFDLIRTQLGTFLRSCGFKDSLVSWIPLSAMKNQNLVAAPSDNCLSSWYRGPYLLNAIDSLQPPTRDFSKPLLMPICDVVISSSQGQVSACGKLEAGALRSGLKVLVMPSGDVGTVRSLERDSQACDVARAGDNVTVSLQGIDGSNVMTGGVLCHPDFPVAVAQRFELKVRVLDLAIPLLIGSQLEFHGHRAKEAATVLKIISVLDPKTGKVTKKAPRCLTSKQIAVIELFLDEPVCVEEYTNCRALGRAFLRTLGKTVALGIITRIIDDQE
ncbi:TRANSLATION FACTOR [Salix purpurea]|uniref:TRANSLATION FACTOR n=1 Tax=Salix purpurea TaxID=77065 RepID=A0A9Q0ULG0_SALPP|nr:TRANSLATION FACTOR [Salix purpurea]